MRVCLALCLVASAIAHPQYGRYAQYYPYNAEPAQPTPCPSCQARQTAYQPQPFYQIPVARNARSILEPVLVTSAQAVPVEANSEAAPEVLMADSPAQLLASSDPAALLASSPEPTPSDGSEVIIDETSPVVVETADSEEPAASAPEEIVIQEPSGPVAERIVLLRRENPKRESGSPDATSFPVQTTSDDPIVPLLTDMSFLQDFDSLRLVRSAPRRVRRSALPEIVPILTNIPAENINAETVESILRSARSIASSQANMVGSAPVPVQSTNDVHTVEPVPAPVQSAQDAVPAAPKAPLSFGMYFMRVKSYNYLGQDLPAAVKEVSEPSMPSAKEESKKFEEQQDKEFLDFMQQMLTEQLSSMLEQQVLQQQDLLKQFLTKQLQDEVKTSTVNVPTSDPVPPTTATEPLSAVPTEKIEVEVIEPVVKGN